MGLKNVMVVTLLHSENAGLVDCVIAERPRSSSGVHSERGPRILPTLPGYLSSHLLNPAKR